MPGLFIFLDLNVFSCIAPHHHTASPPKTSSFLSDRIQSVKRVIDYSNTFETVSIPPIINTFIRSDKFVKDYRLPSGAISIGMAYDAHHADNAEVLSLYARLTTLVFSGNNE